MEFITLELRPRLQSCNVFIAMRRDFRFKNKLEINLMESNVALVLEEISINIILPSVKVIPTSLSALSVTSNWISFRLQMAPSKSVFGSFGTEIVTDSSRTIESIARPPSVVDDLKLLFESSDCNILCTCCKNVISKAINLERFLPLPDREYDPNEWFCCKQNISRVVPCDVQPRETDYLYGSGFSVFHKGILAGSVQVNDNALTCNKCSLHIGTLYMHSSFKVWNCCIDYEPRNRDRANTVNATDPFDDFLTLVKVALNETLVQAAEEIVLQTCSSKRIHRLRIRPMDRKLHLLTEPDTANRDTDTIVLQEKHVAKVLYEYGTSDDRVAGTIDCTNVTRHQVSLSVIEAGLRYLSSSTKRLPHVYRSVATGSDRFLFGYIVL